MKIQKNGGEGSGKRFFALHKCHILSFVTVLLERDMSLVERSKLHVRVCKEDDRDFLSKFFL